MSHFCLLKDPANYRALDWDLLADAAGRESWLAHFERHFARAMSHAAEEYGRSAQKRIAAASEAFAAALGKLRAEPASLPGGTLDPIALERLRQRILAEHDLGDPYRSVRARENAAAVEQYGDVVKTLHVLADEAKWLRLVQCVFVGNVLDLDPAAAGDGPADPVDFLQAVEGARPRPWLVDDYDRLAEDLTASTVLPWTKAVVFVDNAGADFVLGVMPLARELALHGTIIVLAANEGPAEGDILADEAIDVVDHLAASDPDLAALIQAGMLEVVSTGGALPVIDLSDVSSELNDAAADADLVVLEGMGRAVQTNLDAAMTVSRLNLAQVDAPAVAARLGGEAPDCVCRYAPVEKA